jgi:hypothetical protein
MANPYIHFYVYRLLHSQFDTSDVISGTGLSFLWAIGNQMKLND